LFNKLQKEGKTEDLVYAEVIEDKEEIVEEDLDKNLPAEGDAAGEEGEDKD
jgi:hypothetical protein